MPRGEALVPPFRTVVVICMGRGEARDDHKDVGAPPELKNMFWQHIAVCVYVCVCLCVYVFMCMCVYSYGSMCMYVCVCDTLLVLSRLLGLKVNGP